METYLVYVDAANNSNKFWSAKVEGNNLTVEWGRVGYKSQTKVHSLNSNQQAVAKYNNLVFEKKAKGYIESQPQLDSTCSVSEIRRALQLLNILRSCVDNRNFNQGYFQALNEYLQIVPTPLGMQIDPYNIYRTVSDIDYQRELLNSLLVNDSVAVAQITEVGKPETKIVSLKSLTKSFWRHL